ncbi:flagellar hook-associated protein FlgK [Halalkalibacter urbisdiaboli]|uniref:flagellar hook-associated protein FlgK n=1 Tax=Halalkalibacter urbisdiaboli TaxID=1960589 RepID=UPI000B44FDA3|nr:flagellar hook-associated protein FlgK [Halalkalibacter urbisdiaboli]
MTSTFHGLETARRSMVTQQYALHTVGQNIANANTEGYSRQRVNFTQTEPYPSIGMNRPKIPGQIGTGVKADSVQRVREQFLDVQYRNESNKVGYWEMRSKSLEKMEDILNEPSTDGLSSQIDKFWTSLQDLNVDPEDAGARSVVRQRGIAVAETFNYLNDSLDAIRNDYKNEISVTEKEVNSILNQLHNVNKQVRDAEPHGYVTNDLYDEQDRLIDRLSTLINVKVERVQSGGNPNSASEGAVSVYLVDDNGNPYLTDPADPQSRVLLVDGTRSQAPMQLSVKTDNNFVEQFSFSNDGGVTGYDVDLNELPRGEMRGLIESYGYGPDAANVTGLYPNMIRDLNTMAEVFATEINNIHKVGFTLPTDGKTEVGGDFFRFDSSNPAGSIKIHENITNSLNNISAASVNVNALTAAKRDEYQTLMKQSPVDYEAVHAILQDDNNFVDGVARAFAGDGSNAQRLANSKDAVLTFGNDSATMSSFYQGVIGDMAVSAQEANRMVGSSEALRESVQFRRDSVSNVSLDEEMTLMIQFQHAYNAAARNITMVDEMLDRIINGMGVVGR